MADHDAIKEEIGWLKVAFTVAAALAASVMAWMAQHYNTAATLVFIIAGLSALALDIVVALILKRIYHCLRQLEP